MYRGNCDIKCIYEQKFKTQDKTATYFNITKQITKEIQHSELNKNYSTIP
jgi:hypothetical protein